MNMIVHTCVEDRAIPDKSRKTSHATRRGIKLEKTWREGDEPVELVDNDRAKGFFAVFSTCGFYLENRMSERRRKLKTVVRTFSISFGISSASRSLRETGFAEVEERRVAGKAVRKTEGRD